METDVVFILRQAILIAVRDSYGPTTLERAMLPGSSGKYLRLTEKGAAQAEYHPGAADPFIHGIKAMG